MSRRSGHTLHGTRNEMRPIPIATTAIALALALATPPATAAGLSLSRLLPRVSVGAMFEIERSSAAGTPGAASAEEAPAAVRGAEAEPDPAAREAGEALAPPRGKPVGQERAPRWKSLLPGALK